MPGLLIQALRDIDCDGGLREPQEEAVWKALRLQAMEGAQSITPFFTQCLAPLTNNVVSGPPGITSPHFKSRRENKAIEFNFASIDDDPTFGDAFDTPPCGIDELNVRAIKSGQVFIVETGSLTKLALPGLQHFSGRFVFF